MALFSSVYGANVEMVFSTSDNVNLVNDRSSTLDTYLEYSQSDLFFNIVL